MQTLFWYDYETFGLDPQRDRPVQFSGLRTTLDLEVLGPPITLYSRLADDYIPHPEACVTTAITPEISLEKGLRECEFIDRINTEFSASETCVVGYNSIRFDDEFTRYTLYRNLRDPYAREWRNGNSRWDLLNVVRMVRAMRPEGINWPTNELGQPSLRLEHLTKANGIDHQAAHDAESDVLATLALARCVREAQPRMFEFLFEHRGKAAVERLLAIGSQTPLVMCASRLHSHPLQVSVVMPLRRHTSRSNSVWLIDLLMSPEETLNKCLKEQASKPPGLISLQINQCPALAPLNTLRGVDAERLGISLEMVSAHRRIVEERWDEYLAFIDDQEQVESQVRKPSSQPVDQQLYDGFIGQEDRHKLNLFLSLPPSEQTHYRTRWDDERLEGLVFMYRARNYPESLRAEERERWAEQRSSRLLNPLLGNGLTPDLFMERINLIEQAPNLTPSVKATLTSLKRFISAIVTE